jgi:hypothetical protein
MDLTINTPALLFPAISLIMLAYTNRFLALASVVRSLHERYKTKEGKHPNLEGQIHNLKYRLRIIKNMQILGVISILLSITSMFFIYIEWPIWASTLFSIAMIVFAISLCLSLLELVLSTKSLEIELSDMQDEEESIVDFVKKKFKD